MLRLCAEPGAAGRLCGRQAVTVSLAPGIFSFPAAAGTACQELEGNVGAGNDAWMVFLSCQLGMTFLARSTA